jgi:vancomycin resistance protein YoaR
MAAEETVDIFSGAETPKKKKHIAVWVSLSALLVLGTLGGVFGKQFYEEYQRQKQISSVVDVDTFYKGIVVQGIDLGGKTMDEAKAELKQLEPSLRGKYDIKIQYKDKVWDITENDLTFTFNTDSVLEEAYSYARSGDRKERYNQVLALQQNPQNYEITNSMSYDSINAKLKEIAKSIACDPVDASVASFNPATETFQYVDGKNGLAVDENRLYQQVVALINGEKTGTVQVPTKTIPFSKTIADISRNLKKLGTYSTVSTNNANGTHNMKLALSKVNGTCIPAGGTFSFNKIVGDSSNAASGFLKAGAILNGKFIQSYGGGICQASTTIYGAALRSNMKIVQRSNHTIQSTYCPIGQDAAVSYPELDLKFVNPTDYPVYIVTGSKGNVLTATFYGYQSPDYDWIEVTSTKTASIPAPTTPKYTVDKTLAKGVIKLDSKARDGSRATAKRIFYKNGVVVKTEDLPSSYYHALPAFYSIGPGTPIPATPPSSTVSQASSAASSAASKPSSSSSSKPQSAASAPNSTSQTEPPSSSEGPNSSEPSPGDPASEDVLNNDITIPE